MKLNFQRQAGATLIEVIMVVALIAIITIGALVYYNSAQDSSRVSEAVAGVTSLTSVIRNQYSTQGNYNGITENVVKLFGNVPESMLVRPVGGAPANLKHPWDNTANSVKIAPATTTGADDSFTVTFANVPGNICVDLVTKTYRHFLKTTVDGTQVKTVAEVTTACGDSSLKKSIAYTQR